MIIREISLTQCHKKQIVKIDMSLTTKVMTVSMGGCEGKTDKEILEDSRKKGMV